MPGQIKAILNSKGVTLLELLLGVSIFLGLLLPLSTYYLNGIQVYNRVQKQSDLRNEADYVISGMMNIIQQASYFELEKGNCGDKEDLLAVFSDPSFKLIPPSYDETDFQCGLITYEQDTAYNEGGPVSKIKRSIYRFIEPDPGMESVQHKWSYDNKEYIVSGLFRVSQDSRHIIVYLLLAPKTAAPVYQQNGTQSGFTSVHDIYSEVNRRKDPSLPPRLDYIRAVRTEISIGNFHRR